jgi:hypothetical protein
LILQTSNIITSQIYSQLNIGFFGGGKPSTTYMIYRINESAGQFLIGVPFLAILS